MFHFFDPLQPLFGDSVIEDGDGQFVGSAVSVHQACLALNAHTFALAVGTNVFSILMGGSAMLQQLPWSVEHPLLSVLID